MSHTAGHRTAVDHTTNKVGDGRDDSVVLVGGHGLAQELRRAHRPPLAKWDGARTKSISPTRSRMLKTIRQPSSRRGPLPVVGPGGQHLGGLLAGEANASIGHAPVLADPAAERVPRYFLRGSTSRAAQPGRRRRRGCGG